MECLAVGQVSLVEALLPATFGSNQRLERIRLQVDWQPIEVLLQPMRKAPTGRPATRRWCSSRLCSSNTCAVC